MARLFLEFARGEVDAVPADNPIDLYIGGRFAKAIRSAEQNQREAWQACPAAGSYAAHVCPVSALTQLGRWPGRVAITSAVPSHPCANPSDLPESVSSYRSVTLTPDADLDCVSYFAVQLVVDDVGQIVAVNVVWAEP